MTFEAGKALLEALVATGREKIDIMLILQKKLGKDLAEKVLKDARERGVF